MELEVKDVYLVVKMGDVFLLEVFDDVGWCLGLVLVNLVVIFDFEVFFFVGGLVVVEDILLFFVCKYFEAFVLL